MPSGYTAAIGEKDISFKEFTLQCSGAFGARIHQRDDGISADIKLREVDDYHLRAIERAKKMVEVLEAQPFEEYREIEEARRKHELERCKEASVKRNELKQKYLKMLEQVEAWTPPTSEHTGLKDFMIEQIKQSMDFDCSDYYDQKITEGTKPVTKKDWKEDIERAKKDIVYHQERYDEEVKRTNAANEWITQLQKSLA